MEKVDLQELMWRIMRHVGPGTLFQRQDGALVYDAPCKCGDDLCCDEVVLSPTKDRLVWTRMWGSMYFYDKWAFSKDGDVEYLGTVEEGCRFPPVMPE